MHHLLYTFLLLLIVKYAFGATLSLKIPESFDEEDDREVCEVFGLPVPESPKRPVSLKPYSYYSPNALTPKVSLSHNTSSLLAIMRPPLREPEETAPVFISPKTVLVKVRIHRARTH